MLSDAVCCVVITSVPALWVQGHQEKTPAGQSHKRKRVKRHRPGTHMGFSVRSVQKGGDGRLKRRRRASNARAWAGQSVGVGCAQACARGSSTAQSAAAGL